jgi:hypothetical protein
MDELQTLVGKILSDEKFVEALAQNPQQALDDAGISPTVDLLDALKGVDSDSLKKLAAAFDDNQAAC